MFGKKKPKIEQPITPEELSRLNDKKMADAEIEHFHVKNDSIEIVKYKKRRRLLSIILSVCIIILLILFIVSTLVTQWGDLIISIDSPAVKKGIVLSEDADFKTQCASLTAVPSCTRRRCRWKGRRFCRALRRYTTAAGQTPATHPPTRDWFFS